MNPERRAAPPRARVVGGAFAARAAALVVAGGTVLGAAAGCGRPSDSGVTLRFWAMGREGEVVQELLPDFERENPGVRVVVQQIPWTAAHEKLLTAFVGHSTPDVAQLGNTWIAEFAALEALEPFDARRAPGIDSTSFFPGIWETNVIDGVPYGIPWYVDTRLLFYRRDLLERAGYSAMPETWSEWRSALEAIKRVVGDDAYPVFLPSNEFAPLVALGLQAGSPLVGDHGTRGAFSEPEFRRAFDFYLSLYRDRLAPPVSNNEIANMYQEFARGYITMLITGPWNLGEFRNRMPPEMQDAWATAPLPGPTGAASGVSLAGGSSLVVFRRTQHAAAAWRLVEFLSRPEQQVRFFQLTGDLPARRESWTRFLARERSAHSGVRATARARGLDAADSGMGADREPSPGVGRACGARRRDAGLRDGGTRSRSGPTARKASVAARADSEGCAVKRSGRETGAAWMFLAPALLLIGTCFFLPVLAGPGLGAHRLRHLRDRLARHRALDRARQFRAPAVRPSVLESVRQHLLLRPGRRSAVGGGLAGRRDAGQLASWRACPGSIAPSTSRRWSPHSRRWPWSGVISITRATASSTLPYRVLEFHR